jgi:hypothetical protein
LGIKIEKKPDGTLEWTQPTLTQSILKDLKLDGEEIKGRQNKPNIKSVPANTSVPLTDHRESPNHNPKDFEYRHVIGKLLYLENPQDQIYHSQYTNVLDIVPIQRINTLQQS